MKDRKLHIEQLLADLGSLKRMAALHSAHHAHFPAITPAQWSVLMFIEHKQVASVKDVASALHISSSAATQLIDGLVKNEYVVREMKESDRRAVSLQLSKKMQHHVQQMKKQTIQKLEKLFGTLSDSEFTTFCSLSRKIISSPMMHQKRHTQ